MTDLTDPDSLIHFPVSVVMTTYNGERFLEQQLNSILAQTVKPAEIIVCDDASTDETLQLLGQFSKKTPLKFFQNPTRLGVTENFKKAVSLASPGNYISLCDQDDIWLPQKIEQSLAALAKIDDGKNPAMVHSDLILIDSTEKVLNISLHNELGHDKYKHCLATLLFGNFVTGCTIMMNRQMSGFFAEIPDNKSFIYDAWLALIAFSFGKAVSLNHPYIKYRKHENNVTITNHKKKSRMERIGNHTKSLFTKDDFLKDQVVLVKMFYKSYHTMLPDKQKRMIEDFLQLENTSYLRKKLAFETVFANNWQKRF